MITISHLQRKNRRRNFDNQIVSLTEKGKKRKLLEKKVYKNHKKFREKKNNQNLTTNHLCV